MRLAPLALLLAGCAAAPFDAAAWEGRFRREGSAWRGADAVYSVPLSADRILWLFGDTLVTAPDAEGRKGAVMVRNSLAIQALPGDPEFFWRTVEDKPADAFDSGVPGEWLWPLSGLRVGPLLRLFMIRLKAQGDGVFGFAETANLVVTVSNPDDPPAAWRIERREFRFPGCTFGAASVLEDGLAYVYVLREKTRELLVARSRPEHLGEPERWEFRSREGWGDFDRAEALFRGAATEMSVHRQGDRFLAVCSAPLLSPDIQVRTAPRPEGPWSEPRVVYRCPDAAWKKGYFCYAAKAHPELSAADELVITYACNSRDFWDLFRDLRLYWPRFVRIRLTEAVSKP